MPEQRRVCRRQVVDWQSRRSSGHRAGADGRRHRYRLPPLHPQRQPVLPLTADRLAPLRSDFTIETDRLQQQSGCGLLMTEFTSADGLSRMRESKRKRYLTFYDDEHPIGAQLFGSNAETLADAARIVEGHRASTPSTSTSAARPSASSAAMEARACCAICLKIGEIFKEIRKAVTIPFTVKFRLGWNEANIVCVELARMAESEGPLRRRAACAHARAGLHRPGPLGMDRRRQRCSLDPGHRQRRHPHARRTQPPWSPRPTATPS